jgi:tol-pal system protein YbgF
VTAIKNTAAMRPLVPAASPTASSSADHAADRRVPQMAGRLARAAGLSIALIVTVAQPVQAQLFSDDEARRAILDLRGKLDLMQRDLTRRLDDLQARLERMEQGSRGQLDLQNQLGAMRQEIASLRGAVEVQANELSQADKRQRDAVLDLDTRLKRVEPTALNLDGKQITVDPNERRTYEAALAQLRNGDFKSAQAAFQQFQTAYPQSAYGAAVQYWIGSSQYAQKDNKAAITTLQSFVQRYPEHPRTPDALLTLGNAQTDSGDRKAAADTFRLIVQKFPDSTAAPTARDRLAALSAPPKR